MKLHSSLLVCALAWNVGVKVLCFQRLLSGLPDKTSKDKTTVTLSMIKQLLCMNQ